MANEKVILASLDIDVKGLITAAAQSKAEIDKINAALEKLRAAGLSASEGFITLEKQLTTITAKYQALEKAITKIEESQEKASKATNNAVKSNKKLSETIDKTTSSAKEASEQLNNLSGSVESVADNMDDFNDELEETNDGLGDIESSAGATKDAIDNLTDSLETNNTLMEEGGHKIEKSSNAFNQYKTKFKESFNEINIFNGGLKGFGERMETVGGLKPLLVGSLKGMTVGIKGMGKAITANPIGILLQILGPIITKLMEFTPVTKAVEKAMAALGPVIEITTIPLQILAEGVAWLIDGFAELFGSMSSAADEAMKLKKAEEDLATATDLQSAANEKAQDEIDGLLKKSKDQTLSEEERAKAIEKATKIQQKNYKERANLAKETLKVEQDKLLQSKGLSQEDIKIIEEGDTARIQSLLERKDLVTEDIKAYQDALNTKRDVIAEESDLKQQQADNFKSLTDELIEKSKDQSLSEEERLKAVEKVAELESKYYNDRKTENDEELRESLKKAEKKGTISQEEIKKLVELGDAYEGKEQLIKLLSDEERDQLQKILDEKKRINDEEVESVHKTSDAKEEVYRDEEKKREERIKKWKKQRQKNLDDYAEKLDLELKLYIQNNEGKSKTIEEELAFLKKVSDDKIKIAEAEYAASGKTSNDLLKLEIKKNKIIQDQAKKTADALVNHNNAELDAWLEQNKSKIEGAKKLTEELFIEEDKRLEREEAFRAKQLELLYNTSDTAIEKKRNDNIQLSEEDEKYLAKKQEIEEEYQNKKAQNEENRKQAEKERKATEEAEGKEEKLLKAEEENEEKIAEEELRHEEEIERLKTRLEDGLITKKEFEVLERAEAIKSTGIKIGLALQEKKEKLQALSSIAGALGDAFGQSKALATVQAGINGALAITSILAQYPKFDGGIAMAAAIGVASASTVAQIVKINKAKAPKKPKFEQGGLQMIGGNRHSNGGTMFTGADGTQFEAEQGELIGVMNRNAASHFMAFNNAFPAGGSSTSTSNYFANGGIVSRDIATPGVNTDELATKIAQANSNIPAPVVSVQDIVTEGDSYVQVRQGADF